MKRILLPLFFMAGQLSLFSQSLSGIITDEFEVPVANATVTLTRTGEHAHTNEAGKFSFPKIRVEDTLRVTHINYEARRVIARSLSEPLRISLITKSISLDEMVISREMDALNLISRIDIQTRPVNSSQDILRQVPGLFIGQHAGGGKAEQIFLRGFDIDHGTDINISVDGMPVNMVSHAHGQGYADLHFLIPELVQKIDFGKGPYYANQGNFATAGYVDFRTRESLENSMVKMELGQFNTRRLLGMMNLVNRENHAAYVATEFLMTDGPFESPQNFNRVNLFAKYTGQVTGSDKIGVTLSHFTSKWDASGQIPQRAVSAGLITRFGAIDDTEGGNTGRTNVQATYEKIIDERTILKNQAYFSRYDFNLFSNFTFFLEDSIHGDQIEQKETRNLYGLESKLTRFFTGEKVDGNVEAGIRHRNDQSFGNELSHTANRQETLVQYQLGDITETNSSAFVSATLNLGKWTLHPALRYDYFQFQYYDQLAPEYSNQSVSKSILSPKLNILRTPSPRIQYYLKAGKGFHSNDARVVVAQNGTQILPSAYGADAGLIWKPVPSVLVNAALWQLYLQQEFVYVGDAGIVEPSGRTQRQGVDLTVRYQPLSWLFWSFDANYTIAESMDEDEGQQFIPLAPDFTLVSGVSVRHPSGIYAGLNLRHIGDRPANEDNSIVAEGYTVVDANAGYACKKLDFGLQVQNLFNTEWNETQFATESRLQNESQSVEEIHFTPGTPFFLKAVMSYNF